MKRIVPIELQLTRFRSFINPTTINLRGPGGSDSGGMVLLAGENRVEPRLGANGAGKSTVWDGLVFALYGSSVKGLRAGDLVSRGSDPPLEAVLRLQVDEAVYTIRRTAPPNRLSIDGEAAEQTDIDRLLGLTRSRFLHSVVFGQAVPLFLDLSVPDRGDVLDGVLQLEVWLRAADLASQRHRAQRSDLEALQRDIARAEGQVAGLGDPARAAAAAALWEAQREERIEAKIAEFEAAETALETAEDLVAPEPLAEAEYEAKYREYQQRHRQAVERAARLRAERKQIADTALSLAKLTVCPVCEQPISSSHAEAHAVRTRAERDRLSGELETAEIDIGTLDGDMRAAEATWRAVVRTNQLRQAALDVQQRDREARARQLERLEREVERIAAEENPLAAEVARIERELAELSERLAVLRGRAEAAQTALAQLDYWRQGFRRVRLYCLDQVLAELTVATRNALLALGLSGWDVRFTTASETKSGTLRLGVQAEVTSPLAAGRFESCSGGEGQRARLAVSLGLAQLIQRWAGADVAFEVWDEPTAWLSDEGIADLLDCLAERAEHSGKTLWLCDHRALAHGGFRGVVTLVKDRNGSRVAR